MNENNVDKCVTETNDFCHGIYDREFAPYFLETRMLFDRLKSKVRPITDEELNWILISLPLTLFDISGKLSDLKTAEEVIKLRIKELEYEFIKASDEKTAAAKKEAAAMSTIQDKMFLAAYQGIISRVENEISFSRELIMGAKKVWDARRRAEQSNPVSPIDAKTPIYGGGVG